MNNTIRWFALAFGLAFGSAGGISVGLLANASPGDLVYQAPGGEVSITPQQAGQLGQWAINAGA